jgi:hypothetical protein
MVGAKKINKIKPIVLCEICKKKISAIVLWKAL